MKSFDLCVQIKETSNNELPKYKRTIVSITIWFEKTAILAI